MTGLSSHGRPVEVLRYMVPDGFSTSHAPSLASALSLTAGSGERSTEEERMMI